MDYKDSYSYLFNQIPDLIGKLKEIQVQAEKNFILQGENENTNS